MHDSVVWAETPDEGTDADPDEDGGEVDDTLATRRLRHWLRAMFGGTPSNEPPDSDA